MTTPSILAEEAAAPEVTDAQLCEELIDRATVKTPAEAKVAVSWIAEVKTKWNEVDEKRKTFVDPLKSVVKQIDGSFKPALASLKSAESVLKQKLKSYLADTGTERASLLEQVGKTDDQTERETILARVESIAFEGIDGLSVRESWDGEVVDRDALVSWALVNWPELLMIDVSQLKSLTKKEGVDPGIPGWRAKKTSTLAVTASKVRR